MNLRVFRPEEAPATGPVTVRDVLTLYLRHSQANGIHCAEAYSVRLQTFGLFMEEHGDRAVEDCKPFHLTDFIESRPSWKSISTRRSRSTMIAAAFQWAAEGERIARNPFKTVRYTEAERRPELPDETLNQIAGIANKAFERALRWLRLTGCRLGEMCNAEWADIDLARGVWTIQRHKSRKKTGKPKLVALVPEAVELLRAIAAMTPAVTTGIGAESVVAVQATRSGKVFLNTRGKPWGRGILGKALRRVKKRYGIDTKASLHGIRHRFGTEAVASGAPIKLVAEQMGHHSVTVTERYYVHLGPDQLDAMREAAQRGQPKA